MADAPDQAAGLLARASAAIAEAKRLAEERDIWRKSIDERIMRMRSRATFHPKSLRIYSSVDFSYQRPGDVQHLNGLAQARPPVAMAGPARRELLSIDVQIVRIEHRELAQRPHIVDAQMALLQRNQAGSAQFL